MANLVRVLSKSGYDTNMPVPPFTAVTGETIEQCMGLEQRPDGKLYKYTGTLPLAGVSLTPGSVPAGVPIDVCRPTGRFYPGLDVIPGKEYYAAANGEISDTATAQDTKGAFIGRAQIGINNAIVATALELKLIGKMT